MVRVERHIITKSNKLWKYLDNLAFLSKNLYNRANYEIRQTFINTSKEVEQGIREHAIYLNYNSLYKIMKETEDYKALPSQTSQQVLKLLDKNWVSFFKAIKVWKQNKQAFQGRPKLPKYKHKTKGRFVVIFTNQQCRLKNGFIRFPKKCGLPKLKSKITGALKQIRIVPQSNCYIIEVVYNKEVKSYDLNKNLILSIDCGVNNLMALASNKPGFKPLLINGRPLKSINQYYNKLKALYMSWIGNKGISNRLKKLTQKRNAKIKDYLHKASRLIINLALKHKIGKIVIGYNKEWKRHINLGKRNNQNFVQIPFNTLINMIKYKAEEVGIDVITQEEGYTSKCSFLDNESIQKHDTYVGKRIKRGLFKTAKGILINADINGAYNILKKAIPNAFADGIEGVGLHPVKITISNFNKSF